MNAIESIGGNMLAHSSREAIMYQSSVFPKHLGEAISILAAVVKEPLFLPEELKEVKEQVAYEVDAMRWNYPQLLPEKLHQLAFGNNLGETNERYSIQTVTHTNDIASVCTPTSTIGTPVFCDDPQYLSALSSKTLKDFHKTWYTPDRIVVSGAGMAHEQMVELADKYFGFMAVATPEIKAAQQKVLDTPVKYNGGIVLVDTTGQPVSPNPDDRLLTHVYIGFEAPGMLDPDVYAMATLASLMGGGGSFSAGGPGKGMYT
ncbi:UNVERIFIED_CONTAM: Mitochondrial-processing peptidase subunit alpha, partial [Siphonaria sp. JEL0065]